MFGFLKAEVYGNYRNWLKYKIFSKALFSQFLIKNFYFSNQNSQ